MIKTVWIFDLDYHKFLFSFFLFLFSFSVFSFVLVSIQKIYQTLKIVFDHFPNTSKFVKNTPLAVIFSTFFSVFGNVLKDDLSCLVYCSVKPTLSTHLLK